MHGFDHNDGRVHHCTDRNCDPAQRHDVGVHALHPHDQKGSQDAQRQRDDDDQGRAQVQKERRANQDDHNEFVGQFLGQIVDGTFDHARSVIGRDDFDTLRQRRFQSLDLCFDGFDGRQRVLAPAHDDDATNGIPFPVELTDPAAHLWAQPDLRDVAQCQRGTAGVHHQRDRFQVIDVVDVTRGANHVFGLGHLDDTAAGFTVRVPDRVPDLGQRYVEGAQLVRIDNDLVLLDHATDRGDLRDPLDCLQLIFQKPVLDGAQLTEIVAPGPVNQHILIDPADSGGVWPQFRGRSCRQAGLNLCQIFQDPRTRPVQIRPVLEDDIDVRVAKERETTHVDGTGHGQHGSCDGIGDLVFDDLRRLPRIRCLDDHLNVREVRNRVDRCCLDRPDATGAQH